MSPNSHTGRRHLPNILRSAAVIHGRRPGMDSRRAENLDKSVANHVTRGSSDQHGGQSPALLHGLVCTTRPRFLVRVLLLRQFAILLERDLGQARLQLQT